jgi:hypothetical protein
MKIRARLFGLVVSLVLVGLLFLPALVYAAGPDNPGMPDKYKPVPATNIQLVKKITDRAPGPPIVPPGKDKHNNNNNEGAATGVLGSPFSGSRYAVVVGISNYPGDVNDLNYSDDDAIEMANALTGSYGFTNVTLLTDLNATRSAILAAIEAIPQNAGEIVFFFSGHGMNGNADDGDKEKTDEAIVAHDTENLVPIWDGELRDAFSEFTTSRIIFVFDTCLAGGMSNDLEAPGRVIAMATTEHGYAYESSEWGNGEFSYYFVDLGMVQGEANTDDYDGDTVYEEPEQVTVEEAFDYAKANCSRDKPTIGDYFENDLLP